MSFNAIPALKSGSDDFALTLEKEGSMMVAEAFRTKNIIANPSNPNIVWKNEDAGVTSQFIRKAWQPRPEIAYPFGQTLAGQTYGFNEYFIALDPLPIVSHAFVPKHLRRIAHFEMVRPILQGMVDEVSREFDRRAFLALHKASRSTTTVQDSNGSLTMHNGPNRVVTQDGTGVANVYAASATGAQVFRRHISSLRQLAREDDIPDEGSELYITPYMARVLSEDPTIYDVQYSQGQNPNNLIRAAIGEIEGFKVFTVPGTDRLRTTNINSVTGTNGYPSRYLGNYSWSTGAGRTTEGQPVALAVFKGPDGTGPIGCRQVGPVDIEQDYIVQNQGDFMAVAAHVGFDQLDTYLVGAIEVAGAS